MSMKSEQLGETQQSGLSTGSLLETSGPKVAQNNNPIIFNKGTDLSSINMRSSKYNTARLVSENGSPATMLGQTIALQGDLGRLEKNQDYNVDMKAIVLTCIENAPTEKAKIEILEKGLAYLETEKRLNTLVQEGKMNLDDARKVLTQGLNFGRDQAFSLSTLNNFNESLQQAKTSDDVQQKANECFKGTVENPQPATTPQQNHAPTDTSIASSNGPSQEATVFTQDMKGTLKEVCQSSTAQPSQTANATQPDVKNLDPKRRLSSVSENPIQTEQTVSVEQSNNEAVQSSTIERPGLQRKIDDYKKTHPDLSENDNEALKNLENHENPEKAEEIFSGDEAQENKENNVDVKPSAEDHVPQPEGEHVSESHGTGDSGSAIANDKGTSDPDQTNAKGTADNKADKDVNNDLVEKILTTATSNNYQMERSSEERRNKIISILPDEINNATLKEILSNERCSRGVKVALILSGKLTPDQQKMVLDSDTNGDMVKYCRKHREKNVLSQMRVALTSQQAKVTQGSKQTGQFISNNTTYATTNLESFVNAFFDGDQFKMPEDIEAAKDFFHPSTFTKKERERIVKMLKEKKKGKGVQREGLNDNEVISATIWRNMKVDMMIAMFSEGEEENKFFEVVDEMFNYVSKELFVKDDKDDKKLLLKDTVTEAVLQSFYEEIDTIVKVQNIFQPIPAKNENHQYNQQSQYDSCLNMFYGQLIPKEVLLMRNLLDYVKSGKKDDFLECCRELYTWNNALGDKRTMLSQLSKDNYETTVNCEKLHLLRLSAEHSFESTRWGSFDEDTRNGLNRFNVDDFKRHKEEQEKDDRNILQTWLIQNDIFINITDYALTEMDKLAKDIEKAIKQKQKQKNDSSLTPKTIEKSQSEPSTNKVTVQLQNNNIFDRKNATSGKPNKMGETYDVDFSVGRSDDS